MVGVHRAVQTDGRNALVVMNFANSLNEFSIGLTCVADVVENHIITFSEVWVVQELLGIFFGFVVQGCPCAIDTFANTFCNDDLLTFVVVMIFTDDLQYLNRLFLDGFFGLSQVDHTQCDYDRGFDEVLYFHELVKRVCYVSESTIFNGSNDICELINGLGKTMEQG